MNTEAGLTIGLGGALIDPLKMAYDYSQVSKNAQTDELKYTAGAKSALEANKAYEAFNDPKGKLKAANTQIENANKTLSDQNKTLEAKKTASVDKANAKT